MISPPIAFDWMAYKNEVHNRKFSNLVYCILERCDAYRCLVSPQKKKKKRVVVSAWVRDFKSYRKRTVSN